MKYITGEGILAALLIVGLFTTLIALCALDVASHQAFADACVKAGGYLPEAGTCVR